MLKRIVAPVVLKTLRSFVGRWNYEIRQRPRAFMASPARELTPTLEMVLAHYLQSHEAPAFLQIGAFDGRQSDPLYQFIRRYHWRGVLVEPMPDAFARLQEAYKDEPQVRLRNVAVAESDGTKTLHYLRRDQPGLPGWAPMLASFDAEVVRRHGAQIPDIEKFMVTTEVPCVSLESLLGETGLRKVDLLQIDTEGWDYRILKMVDFAKHRPAIINYEHAHLDAEDRDAAIELLVSHGYQVGVGAYDTVAYLTDVTPAAGLS